MQLSFPLGKSLSITAALCALAIIPLAAQQKNASTQNPGTKPASSGEKAEVRTEKFKVKQEFGPQTVARRSDKMTTATPPNQGSSPGASSSTVRQEFGPAVHGPRKQNLSAAGSGGSGGNSQSPSTQKTQASAPK
jgi:hypothetical protein